MAGAASVAQQSKLIYRLVPVLQPDNTQHICFSLMRGSFLPQIAMGMRRWLDAAGGENDSNEQEG